MYEVKIKQPNETLGGEAEDKVGYVACKNCLEETVFIESQATHKSRDYAMFNPSGDGYEADNNEYSWSIEKGSERFVCESCGAYWPVDANVKWIWTGR